MPVMVPPISRAVLLVIAVLLPVSVAAQEDLDVDKVAYCLVANTSSADTQIMKKFIVAALLENTAEMKEHLANLTGVILKLAMGPCEIGLSQLESPAFQQAASKYGEIIGQKVMEEAMSKIQ